MTLRLPTRALVPVVALAVLGGVVATFIVARPPSSAGDDSPSLVRPKLAKRAPAKPAAGTPVRKPVTKRAAKPTPVPAAKPVPVAKPVAVAKPAAKPVDENGLPRVLSTALAENRVVVVSLYDPEAAVDGIALAEARAGASATGAGFVALNVFAEAQSRPLLELLGTLENPAVLVYRRPNTLFARISGFADRETVAQAAANARR
jgi:hypothetical protein